MLLKLSFLSILFLIFFIYYIFQSNYDGQLFHNHSQYGKVHITRDSYGIPHIKAKTLQDVCFGQGFVHGQDRLFQIHMKKLMIFGKISTVAGEKALSTDKFFRTIGMNRIAKQVAAQLEGESKDCSQAYCDGINYYYRQLKIKPLEFIITQSEWEDMTIEDIIGQERLMFFLLGYDYIWESVRSNLAQQFGFEEAQIITAARADAQFEDVTIMNDDDLKNNNLYKKYERNTTKNVFDQQQNLFSKENKDKLIATQLANILNELYKDPNGSNAWVIHGNHTKSGKPLLASDPHLQTQMPAQWIQNELLIENENLVIIGATIPGFPLVQNGRTDFCSWGTTVLFADTSDLYQENIKDGKYMLNGEWKDLLVVEELIYVKGQSEPHVHKVQLTHRGPVLSHKYDKVAKEPIVDIGMNVSLVWTGQILQSTYISSSLAIFRSKTTQELQNGFSQITGPALSVVYATKNGDIGFFGYGKIPIIEDSQQGAFIKDGTTTKQDWIRFTSAKEQPQMMNPKKGYIVTANNRFASDNIKNHISINQISTPRALRINNLIQEHINKGLKFDIEDMKVIQADTIDSYAQIVLPHLVNIYEKYASEILNDSSEFDKGIKMIKLIMKWDCNFNVDSYQASIFMSWEYLFLQKSLHQFKTSDLDRKTITMGQQFEHFYFKKILSWSQGNSKDFNSRWCETEENQKSKHNCLFNIVKSFAEVEDFLQLKFNSKNHEEWRWGQLHRNVFPHMPFTKTFLKFIFERSIEGFGNRRTIAVSVQNWKADSFDASYGSNYRMLVDMSDEGKDFWILDTGISENVFSSHYDDQQKLHEKFEYLQMQRGLDSFSINKKHKLVLEYKNNQIEL